MYQANIYSITNQNRELYSVRPQDIQHGRPDYEHLKSASQIGVAWGPRQSGWGHEGTRTNHGSRIIDITEKHVRQRQHHLNMRRARVLGYWSRLAFSGWLAGFISACFYLSKFICRSGNLIAFTTSNQPATHTARWRSRRVDNLIKYASCIVFSWCSISSSVFWFLFC